MGYRGFCASAFREGKHAVTVGLPLIERVEDDVVADRQEFLHVLGSEGRGIDVRLFSERLSHLLVAETRFVVTARGRAGKVFTELRICRVAGKSLLCEKNMRTGSVRNILQDRGVPAKRRHIHHKSRRRDFI